jgi:hypothetical protein
MTALARANTSALVTDIALERLRETARLELAQE